MGSQYFANQAYALRIGHRNGRERQIARDAIGPKLRLSKRILAQALRGRPQPDVRVQQVTSEFAEAKRRVALNAEVSVFELRVRPCQFEGAATVIGIAILGDQDQEILARPRRDRNKRDLPLFPRFERKGPPDDEHRVQDVAVSLLHRHRRMPVIPPPPKEARAVRFILERSIASGAFRYQLCYPNRWIIGRPEPAPCE